MLVRKVVAMKSWILPVIPILAALAIAPLVGCEGKVSSPPTGTGGSGVPTCSGGQIPCGSQCVNAASDPQNCGACGRSCGAGQTCQNGTCACQAGALVCNGARAASDRSTSGSVTTAG